MWSLFNANVYFMEAVLKEILKEVLCITRVALNLHQPEKMYSIQMNNAIFWTLF